MLRRRLERGVVQTYYRVCDWRRSGAAGKEERCAFLCRFVRKNKKCSTRATKSRVFIALVDLKFIPLRRLIRRVLRRGVRRVWARDSARLGVLAFGGTVPM